MLRCINIYFKSLLTINRWYKSMYFFFFMHSVFFFLRNAFSLKYYIIICSRPSVFRVHNSITIRKLNNLQIKTQFKTFPPPLSLRILIKIIVTDVRCRRYYYVTHTYGVMYFLNFQIECKANRLTCVLIIRVCQSVYYKFLRYNI